MFKTIESQTRTAPPAWAVLERQLMRAIDQAAPVYLEKYTRPGGSLVWREDYPGDGVWADDLYEAFFNWPIYYAVSGNDYIGTKSIEQWSAVTRQITYDYGRAHKEFINNDDWFHNSENYIYFYHLGLVDPAHAENRRRAQRFAGFYMNEDPEVANYDGEKRVVRSPFSGSKGPLFDARFADVHYNIAYGHATLGPGFDFPEDWHEDEAWRQKVHARFNEVVMQGDIPVNLGIVALVTNAFLYTGEERYRQWVVDYVQAWLDRIEKNGGIIPDNIGLNGEIGENREGQWWGGFYGWTGLYSLHMMGSAMMGAAECAQLLTGDSKYLELIRSQLDLVIEKGHRDNGVLQVPFKHTDEGWGAYGTLIPQDPIHLWAASMEERDQQRLTLLREGAAVEWCKVTSRGPRSLDDRAWTRYLAGDFPSYPEEILQANYQEVCRRLQMVVEDDADLKTVNEHHWQQRNPVLTEALEQLAMGGPQTIYWGGLVQGRVRYFDAEEQRAGLPEEVAALVTGLRAEQVDLTLVNLSPLHARKVIVAAGCFAEHQFTSIEADGVEIAIDDRYVQIALKPGTQIDLSMRMQRFAHSPTYAWPWHGEGIPFR